MPYNALPRQTLGSATFVELPAVHDDIGGVYVIHISGTWVGTIQTKAYVPGNGLTSADRQPIPYSGKTGTLTDPTTTGITANGVYKIPMSAAERLILEMTAYTSGAALIDPNISLYAG